MLEPPRNTMDARLFSRLWREIDFDDHPHTGGHGSEPEGNLVTDFGEGWIRLKDERMSLSLGVDCEADSVHRWTTQSVQMNEGPTRLGVHRWSISPDDLAPDLCEWVLEKIGEPKSIEQPSVVNERAFLRGLRNCLESDLEGWTLHLEVDNKPDRMGWYIRAPDEWCSLFTIFVGLHQSDSTGFFLFERAPPGELDRPDEAEANRLDGLRTVALCNASRGALSMLAGDMHWAANPRAYLLPDLSGTVQLWPPSMGRWPLLHARADADTEVSEWALTLVNTLKPAISTLSAKIEGLNWH